MCPGWEGGEAPLLHTAHKNQRISEQQAVETGQWGATTTADTTTTATTPTTTTARMYTDHSRYCTGRHYLSRGYKMREMSHTDVRCDSGAVVTCHESRCHEGDYLYYLLSPTTATTSDQAATQKPSFTVGWWREEIWSHCTACTCSSVPWPSVASGHCAESFPLTLYKQFLSLGSKKFCETPKIK